MRKRPSKPIVGIWKIALTNDPKRPRVMERIKEIADAQDRSQKAGWDTAR